MAKRIFRHYRPMPTAVVPSAELSLHVCTAQPSDHLTPLDFSAPITRLRDRLLEWLAVFFSVGHDPKRLPLLPPPSRGSNRIAKR